MTAAQEQQTRMDNDERTNLAQWAKDAQQRSRKAILYMFRGKRSTRQQSIDLEDRMNRAGEKYQRTPSRCVMTCIKASPWRPRSSTCS
jgi:hypothetical protein